jgi:uncharacterized protein YjbI with pentapeptide repeats
VKLVGAVLSKADLNKANLANADLTNADLRNATLTDAKLEGANLTGAKVHGLTSKGAQLDKIKADWVDNSPNADGSERVTGAEIQRVLAGEVLVKTAAAAVQVARSANHRFFGKGDVLRNATLSFDEGATIEIESLFEACTISLGRGTELLIGSEGILDGCQIKGAGNITVKGKFFEATQKKMGGPAIQGVHSLIVSATGSLVGAVQQPAELTRFAFEPGCKLRMKISKSNAPAEGADKGGGNGQGEQRGGKGKK